MAASKSDAPRACPIQCSTQSGVDQWSDAAFTGNVSTVALIAGGVALAAGALLWFTAPSAWSAQVGLAPNALQVKGTW
jgi:hypothetical protein